VNGLELALSGPALAAFLEAVLDKGTSCRFRATGVSMFPFIRGGDVVTVSPLPHTPLRHGDVAAALLPGNSGVVLHRVVGRRRGLYLIKGDARTEVDGWIPRHDLLGRVTSVERAGKSITFGLGRERVLVAALTRSGLLPRLVFPLGRAIRSLLERTPT
jgi:hypothetical protein